jgi:hypothetical protein
MNLLELTEYKSIERSVLSWWESKSKDEKLKLETYGAIILPTIGSLLGSLLVLIVL